MDCKNCQENISAYLDGELTAAEAARVNQHCAQCEDCGRELENTRALTGALRGLDAPVMKRNFAADLSFLSDLPESAPEPVMAAEPDVPRTRSHRARRAWNVRRFGSLAAVLLVGFVIGFGAFELDYRSDLRNAGDQAAVVESAPDNTVQNAAPEETEDARPLLFDKGESEASENKTVLEEGISSLSGVAPVITAGSLCTITVADGDWEAVSAYLREPRENLYVDLMDEKTIIAFCDVEDLAALREELTLYLPDYDLTVTPPEERSDWVQIEAEYEHFLHGHDSQNDGGSLDQQLGERLTREKTMVKFQLTRKV